MLAVDPGILEVAQPIRCAAGARQRIPADYLALLLPRDRLLVELSVNPMLSRRQMGLALGLNAGNVARRLRKLQARLSHPVAGMLADPRCTLPRDVRQIGVEHFIQGIAVTILARQHEMTVGQVRAQLQFIRGWHRGQNQRREI